VTIFDRILLAYAILVVGASNILFDKFVGYFRESDNFNKAYVKPRPLGIALMMIDILFWLGMGIYSLVFIGGFFPVPTIFIAILESYLCMEISTTKLHYEEDRFVFSSITSNYTFSRDDISHIHWTSKSRIFGLVFEISLYQGVRIQFPHVYFIGINNLGKFLANNAEDDSKTGDGSVS
jgi:hypothetical protein